MGEGSKEAVSFHQPKLIKSVNGYLDELDVKDAAGVADGKMWVCPAIFDKVDETYCSSFSKGLGCKNWKRGRCTL